MLPARQINGVSVGARLNDRCLACHDDGNSWFEGTDALYKTLIEAPARDSSGYPTSGTWLGPKSYESTSNPHRLIPETTQTTGPGQDVKRQQGDCLYCHASHRGSNRYDSLVATFAPSAAEAVLSDQKTGDYAALCLECHGGVTPSGFTTAPADIKQYVTADSQRAGHRVKTPGGVLPVGAPLPCYECHNPHGSKRENASMLSDALGRNLDTGNAVGVRQFCFTCHTTSDKGSGWNSGSVEPTYTAVAQDAKVVGISRLSGVLKLPALTAHTEASPADCYACHGDDYSGLQGNVHNPSISGYDPGTHTAAPAAQTFDIRGTTFPSRPCEECHSIELGAEHLKSSSSSSLAGCDSCHPSPRDSLAPWNKSCTQAGCHTTGSSAPMHASIDASHAVPASTCTPSGCHALSSTAAIHSDATTTTASATLASCQVCHSSGVPLTSDCASCHDATTPHEDEAAAHLAIPGSGDIPMGLDDSDHGSELTISEECLSCHFADLRTQHANQCPTCHSGSNPIASLGTWDKTCQQGDCHPSIHTGMTANHHDVYTGRSASCDACHTGVPSWPGDVDCSRCHARSDTIPDGLAPVTTSDAQASYNAAATIHLSAVDPGGSGVASTRFKLDLGAWQTGTTLDVAAPANGTAAHTLSFYSVDEAGNSELANTVVFTVVGAGPADITGPMGTMSVDGDAAYARAGATVVSAVNDSGTGLYGMSIDPGTGVFGNWVAYAPSIGITLPAPDGGKTVRVQYKDLAGNITTLTDSVIRDATAPLTTCDAVSGSTYTGDQTFTITSTDAGSGVATTNWVLRQGTVGSGGPVVGSGSGTSVLVPAPETGAQQYTIEWDAIDFVGNGTNWKSVSFTVQKTAPDTTPPTTTSSFDPAAGAIYNNAQSVTLSAVDNTGGSGIQNTYYRIDSGAFTAGTSCTVSGEGLHTFSYYSVDKANNIEGTHVSNQFRIDTVAPTTTANIIAGNEYTGAQTFTLTPTDANGSGVAGTWWQLDGTSGVWNAGTTVPVVATGLHTLYWYSVDTATNSETVMSATFSISASPVDTTPPTTTSNFNPAAGAIYNSGQLVTLTAVDNVGGSDVQATHYRIDSGPEMTGTSFTVTSEGLHTFSYYSVDNANNIETVHTSNQFGIDTVAPATTCSIGEGATFSGAQVFTLTPSDPDPASGVVATFWQLDSTAGPWTPGTGGTVVAPASGTASHSLYWYSVDAAGNTQPVQQVTFSVSAPDTSGTTTLSATIDSGSYHPYMKLSIYDELGSLVAESDWSSDEHTSTWPFPVPSGRAYTMYMEWELPDYEGGGTGSESRLVTAAEALPNATVSWTVSF